jgi:hypothetical protein
MNSLVELKISIKEKEENKTDFYQNLVVLLSHLVLIENVFVIVEKILVAMFVVVQFHFLNH